MMDMSLKETANVTDKELAVGENEVAVAADVIDVAEVDLVANAELRKQTNDLPIVENEKGSDDLEHLGEVYKYLSRDEFTSEIYKMEIFGLPKYFGVGQLRKKMENVGVNPLKIKFFPNQTYVFVTFRNENERSHAMKAVHGLIWKGHTLSTKEAKPAKDPYVKRKLEAEECCIPKKVSRQEEENVASDIERVTPLVNITYEDQLKKKMFMMQKVLKKFVRKHDLKSSYAEYMKPIQKANYGMPCPLLQIKASPLKRGYRNKSEMTIGRDNTGTKRVGFRIGSYRSGNVTVMPVKELTHIPDTHKLFAHALEEFVQSSQLDVYDPTSCTGCWKQVLIRTNSQSQIMSSVMLHSQGLSEEEVGDATTLLKKYFEDEKMMELGLVSLSYQTHNNKLKDNFHHQLLLGKDHIKESLLDFNFKVSPSAFFQVNSGAAELLYSQICDWCDLCPQTVLLDICCGTGTIGITMAKKVHKVIGVEMCPGAIADARENAKINDLNNCEYHCCKAEDAMSALVDRLGSNPVVAVVDPPRSGLHPQVIKALRKCEKIKTLVYVACNPEAALTNLFDLTKAESKRMRGTNFCLMQAMPVDLFPDTPHCELIMQLKRQPMVDGCL